MIDLPPHLAAGLRASAAGLTLQMRFVSDGERRAKPWFGALNHGWHKVATIVDLAKLGLVEGATDDCDMIVPTAEGKAWLKANPPP